MKNELLDIPLEVKNKLSEIVFNKAIGSKYNRQILPEILFITSYSPRECGIATYSQDLIDSIKNKFSESFTLNVCALESDSEKHVYPEIVTSTLNTDHSLEFEKIAIEINNNLQIKIVMIQHEFGFFLKKDTDFINFLKQINKPIITVFHTVIPKPNLKLEEKVKTISSLSDSVVVMTNTSANILAKDYSINPEKITVIPHGTHLVKHIDKNILKEKYGYEGKKVLSTFGLLSAGKNIETTLDGLTEISKQIPNVLFLIIGKTHPGVLKEEGEKYRQLLERKVQDLGLENHVQFINSFLPLPILLEYLQLTDIYLFTSNDPNQAVSGTFSYAISCGCPVITTPIPHALEVLKNNTGICIDFGNSGQLSAMTIKLLKDEALLSAISSNGLHCMATTAWENSAIAHALLFEKILNTETPLYYNIAPINLAHFKKLTTDFGMIQFSIINHPDINSGYTLDDNARALIAISLNYEIFKKSSDVRYIHIYLKFIKLCMQEDGYFINYIHKDGTFDIQNNTTNLADANGRAIWALGYLISLKEIMPTDIIEEAELIFQKGLKNISKIHSTRAMAFVIKGLYYNNLVNESESNIELISELAKRLVQMYRHENDDNWQWFESYLTYANSILPEALLCAWLATSEPVYKEIAKKTFDFLLSKIFIENKIKVISNKSWLHNGSDTTQQHKGGEQPIDVAYTILALSKFSEVFSEEKNEYTIKIYQAFNWFLGSNHLHKIIYNPCTGGCYDGLENNHVNLNQGAESTISYLLARLSLEKIRSKKKYMNLVPYKNKMSKFVAV
jgi:glycosyltransferase involved in cell wall biosynthesis